MFHGLALGIEHGETVMVFGRDDDVFHAGVLGGFHPGVGIEIRRVEFLGELLVFGHGDFAAVHDPFADARHRLVVIITGGHGIDAPVDEHAELGLAPPRHAGIVLLRGFRSFSGLSGQTGQEKTGTEQGGNGF